MGPSCRSSAGAMWSAGRGRAAGRALLGLLLTLLVPNSCAAKTGAGLVTCGSVLKLFNTQHRVRLHSHDIKYGSGALGQGLGYSQGAEPGAGSLKVGWPWGSLQGYESRGHQGAWLGNRGGGPRIGRFKGVVGTLGARRVVQELQAKGLGSSARGQGLEMEAGSEPLGAPGLRLSWNVYGVWVKGREFED